MAKTPRLAWALLGLGVSLVPLSCGGGSGGGSSSKMVLEEATNGFGRLLPYETFRADEDGFPTEDVVEIRSLEDLVANVNLNNPIHEVATWPTTAQLPDGAPGNHFFHARFRQPVDPLSVFDVSGGGLASNLAKSITVLAVDPITGTTTTVRGQGFVGGKTVPIGGTQVQTWVRNVGGTPTPVTDVDGDGVDEFTPTSAPGHGFPGTEQAVPFNGAVDLVDPRSFVFVPDTDGDLSTHETFPVGVQIKVSMETSVLSLNGEELEEAGVATSTVGTDDIDPEVAVSGPEQTPKIVPPPGEPDVDPQTAVTVTFTEAIQLPTLGDLPDGSPPSLSAAIKLQFGPSASTVEVPYTVRPRSPYDLTTLILEPAYAFPGQAPAFEDCGAFNQVTILVNSDQFEDLSGNRNTLQPTSFFTVGEGPGLVNAPVVPDAIYAWRLGSGASISIIDLNGFGAGTGNPTWDPLCPIEEGNSNYPNNPNVQLQGSLLVPPLTIGGCTFNGGSAGPFTLTRDSALDTRLVRSPLLSSIEDMMLGHALDNVFNNGSPFGCQSGGGNLCASTGLKQVLLAAGGSSTLAPSTISTFPIKIESGMENLMSWAPHPNPPPLVFPPLCLSPNIGGQEPTSIDTTVVNLLVPGPNPLGVPTACIPPQNLLTPEQNSFFQGPSLPATPISNCSQYALRQQVGNFLYVADRVAQEVVVLNSNRMTVVDRIQVPDPTSFAMSPDLDFLAITNEKANSVSFINIDPTSSSFHQIVKTTPVGKGPTGIAWESGNEDIFVCNQGGNTVSIISAFTLSVRKTLLNQLQGGPFEVVLTPRQLGFGLFRGVYYGYILNLNGSISLFESGPDGVNGWGFDDVIGQPEFKFNKPRAIAVDTSNLNSAVWIAHEDKLGFDGNPTGLKGGAISNMFLESGIQGIIPLDPGSFVDPQIRDLEFSIRASIGEEALGLTGVPVDLAFDDQRNRTALTNFTTSFSAGFPLSINGKSLVKPVAAGFAAANTPQFLFVAVPNSDEGPGVVDVIHLEGGFQRFDTNPFQPGTQSIQVPGVRGLSHYFRQ